MQAKTVEQDDTWPFWSDEARQSLARAADMARADGAAHTETVHLLRGLLEGDTAAAQVLAWHLLTPADDLSNEVRQRTASRNAEAALSAGTAETSNDDDKNDDHGEGGDSVWVTPGLSRLAAEAVARAIADFRALRGKRFTTEYLLSGLLQTGRGSAAGEVLAELGVDTPRLLPTLFSADAAAIRALHQAARDNNAAALRRILRLRVRVDAIGWSSPWARAWTALMHAAHAGAAEAVRFLLDAGADAAVRDEDSFTAEDLARIQGHSEIERMLRKTGESP